MTEDFQFFYRLVRSLKERKEPFVSLSFEDPVPWNVSVIITTEGEKEKVPFEPIAAGDDPEQAIDLAKGILKGRRFATVIVGIDPGMTIGIVVRGDGKLIRADTFQRPESAGSVVRKMTADLESGEVLVRIGHGDRTIRNRIIRSVWGAVDRVEIVDETNTTKNTETPDIDAAILISKTQGLILDKPPEVSPTPGEVREVQRRSRIESGGSITIDANLAGRVARGEMSMEDALSAHSEEKKKKIV